MTKSINEKCKRRVNVAKVSKDQVKKVLLRLKLQSKLIVLLVPH